MMNHILHNISKFGMAMGYLIVTGAGCFVFTSGFRAVAGNETGLDTE